MAATKFNIGDTVFTATLSPVTSGPDVYAIIGPLIIKTIEINNAEITYMTHGRTAKCGIGRIVESLTFSSLKEATKFVIDDMERTHEKKGKIKKTT